MNLETKGKISSLKIHSKNEWLFLKKQFKEIKKELLQSVNKFETEKKDGENKLESNNFIEKEINISPGTLIKIENLNENTNKQSLKISLKHFGNPIYLDLKKKLNNCIVRFNNCLECNEFYEKITKKEFILEGNKVKLFLNF